MDLPINDKELETIISALRLGGDTTSLYQKLWTYKMNYRKQKLSDGFSERNCKRNRR